MVRDLHALALERSGGLPGIHGDKLLAACGRPFHTMFGDDLYPTPVLKAAALFHAIIAGHVFVDGNKRTATMAAVSLLQSLGYLDGNPSGFQNRLFGELAIETALPGSLTVGEIAEWFDRILGPRT